MPSVSRSCPHTHPHPHPHHAHARHAPIPYPHLRRTSIYSTQPLRPSLHAGGLSAVQENVPRSNVEKILGGIHLGLVKSMRLLDTCPFCRLIFDITHLCSLDIDTIIHAPDDTEGNLALNATWTINRLEPDLGWPEDDVGKGVFSGCIHTFVTSRGQYRRPEPVYLSLDAIGVAAIEAQTINNRVPACAVPGLRVKIVDPRTPDYLMIQRWLRQCDEHHPVKCHPLVSTDLAKIKLVEVETRRIVQYPSEGCDYIALSYVWGGVEQPSYKLGDILPTVPAILEDAMVVTRQLGKRYLWADSLCIEQGNSAEKSVQIGLMGSVYSGAWVTIVCLSGKSARSGLPRVGTLEGVIPRLSCEIQGKRWLSIMPTLSQQLAWSVWATRAWTFQEALLSRRRLFFTNHQVYFQCNSVHCCESLDESNSRFHVKSKEQGNTPLDRLLAGGITQPSKVQQGILADPFRFFGTIIDRQSSGVDDYERMLQLTNYLALVSTYSKRKMTLDADSINAFAAVLSRFEELFYQEGFVCDIPVSELPRALLWTHEAKPARRYGFPTWSWAGWEGPVHSVTDFNTMFKTFAISLDSPPLRIWNAGKECLPEILYDFNPMSMVPKNSVDRVSGKRRGRSEERIMDKDPILLQAKQMFEAPSMTLLKVAHDELLVEGVVLGLKLPTVGHGYTPESGYQGGSEDVFDLVARDAVTYQVTFETGSEPLTLGFYGVDAKERISERARSGFEQQLLVLSREVEWRGECALLHIELDGESSTASRVGVALLRFERVEHLLGLKFETRMFKLK